MRTWFLHIIEDNGSFYVEGMEVEYTGGSVECSDFDQFGPKFANRAIAEGHLERALKGNPKAARWNFLAQKVYDGASL